MKIIKPVPPNLDHWDLVWYQRPDFPKTLFARIPYDSNAFDLPTYEPSMQICQEYTVPRKFRFQTGISESAQVIWMEHRPGSPETTEKAKPKKLKMLCVPKDTRLMPKKIDITGLSGKDLLLARRKMAKPKFLAS
ncbi:uncharacterized protein LOC119192805 [Manduca sexta]|uniref:uncharacterized protein LOC119192805 n=1 Tax=Manduca sexta TaxID=7130 RepID=UPI00188FF1F1|nr:uncharacterized protein LOC119192805 [Manduca sexta]